MTHGNYDSQEGNVKGLRFLYRISGISTLIIMTLLALSILAYTIWPYAAGRTPLSDIFMLVKENFLAAFTALDMGYWLINLVSIVLYIALYFSLRKENEVFSFIALVLGLIGVVSLFSARPVIEILGLGDLYSTAITEAEKIKYLASGEALIVHFHGSAWYISVFLTTASQLISAILMIKSKSYGRATAYIGVTACSVGLAFWIPHIGIVFFFLSMMIFYGLADSSFNQFQPFIQKIAMILGPYFKKER